MYFAYIEIYLWRCTQDILLDLYLCLTNDNSRQRKCRVANFLKKTPKSFAPYFAKTRGWKVKRLFGKSSVVQKKHIFNPMFCLSIFSLTKPKPWPQCPVLIRQYFLIGGLQSSVGVPLLVVFYNFPAEASVIRSNWSLHTRPLSLLIFPIWLLLLLPSTAGADNTENIDSWVKMTKWKG